MVCKKKLVKILAMLSKVPNVFYNFNSRQESNFLRPPWHFLQKTITKWIRHCRYCFVVFWRHELAPIDISLIAINCSISESGWLKWREVLTNNIYEITIKMLICGVHFTHFFYQQKDRKGMNERIYIMNNHKCLENFP